MTTPPLITPAELAYREAARVADEVQYDLWRFANAPEIVEEPEAEEEEAEI